MCVQNLQKALALYWRLEKYSIMKHYLSCIILFLYPHLNYCKDVWGKAHNTYLKDLLCITKYDHSHYRIEILYWHHYIHTINTWHMWTVVKCKQPTYFSLSTNRKLIKLVINNNVMRTYIVQCRTLFRPPFVGMVWRIENLTKWGHHSLIT